jgi:hypothetical protein
MAKSHKLEGEELFLSYISEYLDGDLPAAVQTDFSAALTGREAAVDEFQLRRGKLQSHFSKIVLSESGRHKIRNLLQDDQHRETMEAGEILSVERSEMFSNILRRSVLALLILGTIGAIVYISMPTAIEKINVIEYLGYEALAFEEDFDNRVNFPSNDLEDIKTFAAKVPGLNFTPQVMRPLTGWNVEGASMIDYEVVKIVSVIYKSPERQGEHLHHFMIPGAMSQIPFTGDEADYRGIRYRVYASDKLNMLVWQMTPQFVSVLAGHRSAPELAELARAGTPE